MKKMKLLALVVGLAFMGACSDDSEDHSNVSGSAVKGYIGSANVDIYQYTEAGVRGKLLASTKTDINGNYSAYVDHKGAIEIVVSGGSYVDEASGKVVALGENELRSLVVLDGSKEVAVTALTTIAAEHADAHATAGLDIAIENANRAVARAFGLSNIDITTVIPADLSHRVEGHSEAQIKYGAIQAGFSQYLEDKGYAATDLLALIKDFAKDYADGAVDNHSGHTALEFSLTVTPQEAFAGLSLAIENFLKSEQNKSEFSGSISFSFSASASGQ